jgi:poly(hydroxyalkanoate) depolymerase family esterase
MAGLGETTARLVRLRREQAAAAAASAGALQLAETKGFGPNPGGLRMFEHTPPNLASDAPLVVVLHGCGQGAAAYAWGSGWATLADRYGFGLVVPEQAPANNANLCFNWFEPGDASRGAGEAASIRAMVAAAAETRGYDPSRVFVTGLSAGGAMTTAMLAAYPEVFAAGAVVAGLPYGAADNLQGAFWAMLGSLPSEGELAERLRRAARGGRIPRISIWHGDADTTVERSNAVEIARQWAEVLGLAAGSGAVEALPGRTRTIWRDSADGRALIELNLLHGFGHGTPLATAGPEGLGTVGPFLLEAGVSSTLEIARFWGLVPPLAAAPPPPEADAAPVGLPGLAANALRRAGQKP